MIVNLFPISISHTRFELTETPVFETGWEKEWGTYLLIPELKKFIDLEVNKYFKDCGFTDVDLAEYSVWLNTLESSGRHIVPHNHGIALVGWVYYIDVPENSGDIVFLNPQGNNSWDYFYHNEFPGSSPNNDLLYKFKPKTGDLLMFPGWLSHYVEPNNSNQTRISMAGEYHTQKFVNVFVNHFNT